MGEGIGGVGGEKDRGWGKGRIGRRERIGGEEGEGDGSGGPPHPT